MASGPLVGVRVLDFTHIVSGPYGGAHLADFGADVIKVEPPGGDPFRNLGAATPGGSKQFQSLNRGKRSIALNLKDERARQIIHRMIPQIDVVLVNYRADVAKRLSVDYETLRAIRPDIIYLQNTGFGNRGPRALTAASDLVIQAYGGLMAQEGKVTDTGAPGIITSVAITDYVTGVVIAMGVCMALYHRQRTGQGQILHTSLFQSSLSIQHGFIMREPVADAMLRDPLMEDVEGLRAAQAGYAEILAKYHQRRRAGSAFSLYYTGYQCRDGGIVFGALTRANRDVIRKVIGITVDQSDTPDFNPLDPASQQQVEAWRAEIQRIMLTRSVAEWMADFEAAEATVSPVQFPEEMADDPQTAALGMMVELEHELTGYQRMVGPVMEMSATPPRVQGAAPLPGSHTDEILAQFGYAPDEIAALVADGVALRPFDS
ncbi:MAG: CoA transferase [Dehalococcoidia bacterium]